MPNALSQDERQARDSVAHALLSLHHLNLHNADPLGPDSSLAVSPGELQLLVDAIDRLTRELGAAQKDAARLDWLNTQMQVEGDPSQGAPDYCWWAVQAQRWDVRAGIDDAMSVAAVPAESGDA